MALFYHTHRIDLPESRNIEDLKNGIADHLRLHEFGSVVHNQFEVAGDKNNVRLSVAHLPISGNSFWQLIAAGGNDFAATQTLVNNLVAEIE
jgi:hypothetical protein